MELTEHGEGRLRDLLRQEQENGNLPKLKLGYNRVFGYYFELSRAGGYPPAHFERRQTLANCERYVTPTLKELEEKLLAAGEKRKTLEYNLFLELRERVAAVRDRVMARLCGLRDALADLPVTLANLDAPRAVRLSFGGHIGVARLALEADHIVNVPRLKCHDQMGLSAGVKNLFGCVCGFRKSLAHQRFGSHGNHFARMTASERSTMGRSK